MDNLKFKELYPIFMKRTIYLTGGRDRKGGPIIYFPDTLDREIIKPREYASIIIYFLEISSVRSTPFRFTIIFDVRESNQINLSLLKTLHREFNQWINQMIIIRNTGSKLKKLSFVSDGPDDNLNRINTEVIFHCDLPGLIDLSQVTYDLGGTLKYNHDQWIDYRLAVDFFLNQVIIITQRNTLRVFQK